MGKELKASSPTSDEPPLSPSAIGQDSPPNDKQEHPDQDNINAELGSSNKKAEPSSQERNACEDHDSAGKDLGSPPLKRAKVDETAAPQ